MATTVWGFPNGKEEEELLLHSEVNALADGAELALVQLAELVGPGVWQAGDLNLSIGAGLSVDVSAGTAIVGDSDERKIVRKTGSTNVGSLTASATNYIYLQRDGTFVANTTGTAPAGALLVGSCVTSGGAVTSVNSAPSGRVNLFPLPLSNGGTGATSAAGARTALGVAPLGAQYLTLAADGDLTAERVLTAGDGLGLTDGGAGAAAALAVNVDGVTVEINADALRVKDAGITAAKLAAALQDALPTVTITVGAESLDTIEVTAQAKDAAGNNLAERVTMTWWLSDSAHALPTATAPGGTWSVLAYSVAEWTAKVCGVAASDANGLVTWGINHVGARTWYLHVAIGDRVYVSGAIAFT